jgi:YHS domain-containing protein
MRSPRLLSVRPKGSSMLSRRALLLLSIVAASAIQAAAAQVTASEHSRLALKGYDPVAYFTDGRPVEGRPEFELDWDEARYRFASAKHLDMFKAEPDRYAPQYRGFCAGSMARGRRVEAEPQNWVIDNGRLFVFGSFGPSRFLANPEEAKKLGEAHWQELRRSGS